MLPPKAEHIFDLAFVGVGISGAYTLDALVDQLRANRPIRPVRIALIENGPELFAGVAYGARSGSTARIITPLSEFLAPPERRRFVQWLQDNMSDGILEIGMSAGRHTSAWLAEHRAEIAAGACDDLYLPRALFGHYVRWKLEAQIAASERETLIDVTRFRAEATSIDRSERTFDVRTDRAGVVHADVVVLAVGSPPTRSLLDRVGTTEALLIDDPYQPGLTETVGCVASRVAPITGRPPTIVIIGANATMMDLIYHFEDHPVIAGARPRYCVMSYRGILPGRLETGDRRATDLPHLEALAKRTRFRSADIRDAVIADLEYHGAVTNDVGWLTPAINRAIGALVVDLTLSEQQAFANSTGTEIGRLQRRAGADYYRIVDELDAGGRIDRVSGSFDQHLFELTRTSTYDVIVNASGSAGVTDGRSPLLQAIIANRLATPTECRAGFSVNDRLEAHRGLFVIGPLLAGNVLDGRPIWHLEHAGRIIEMSAALGRHLGQSFL